ncbi:hypothetical protein F9278_21865 [Streptomyces phaeolivaceus]|uniref:Uncharacterized protein n=1 Tax=Streptomyces phaeolivaceus TaxID=2653200 RepID=A0A5P8K6G7_9ACTN|nr:hypothetical protein [Streptomyces phaeolivaceus]QFQ98392.1 hypothetical protein F9278_21865 [Streptomyces phaeolivaceus]
MVVWEVVVAAFRFAAAHLVGQTLGPIGLLLLVVVGTALRIGQVRLAWWTALLFLLLMMQA